MISTIINIIALVRTQWTCYL